MPSFEEISDGLLKKFTDDELVAEIQGELTRSRYLRFAFERDWYGNLLFKQGHHWIVWDETGRRFRQKKLKPWVPQPVTNRFASTLDAIVALLLRVEPAMQWRSADPNNESLKSVAETSTQLLSRIKDMTYFPLWRQTLAGWLTYTGNAYLVNYYDQDGGIPINVPIYKCKQCGAKDLPTGFEDGCKQCGSREYEYEMNQETGLPQEIQFTGGSLRSEIASPFEIFYDFSCVEWHRQPQVTRVKDRTLEYFKLRYGTRGADVEAGGASTLGEFYSSSLAYMASGPGINPSAGQVVRRPGNAEVCYYRQADDRYPEGLTATIAGNTLLEKVEALPKDHTGNRFIPVTQFLFDPIPGSAVGKTVASDLRPKQKQRNELESLIQLITMRMANPVWIIPYGTDVEGFSGQPGAVLKAIQLSPNANSNPQRLPGENVPSSVMAWLEKIDTDLEEMASIFDVLKGQAPTGVTAGYALQLLIERGQSRWGPLFQRWENGFVMWAKQVTAFTKEYMPAEQITSLLGEHADWEVTKFKEESMAGLNLTVEAGSAKPQSALAEQALVEQLMGQGLIDPTDPAIKAEILRSVGMSKYDHLSDWDMKDAAREEEAFYKIAMQYDLAGMVKQIEQQVQSAPEDPAQVQQVQQQIQQVQQLAQSGTRFREQIDNHQIHLWAHKRFAKTDRFMKLSSEWQAAWLQHITLHAQRLMQESMQMAMGPQQPGQPAGDSKQPPKPTQQPEQPGAMVTGPGTDQLPATTRGGHVQNPIAMAAG